MDLLGFFVKGLIGPSIQMLQGIVNNMFFFHAFQQVFFFERLIGIEDAVASRLEALVALFATLLLVVKLLYKLFNIYVIQVDGDDTVSPMGYFRSFAKGLVLIYTFTIAYDWLYQIVRDFGQQVLGILGTQTWEYEGTMIQIQIFTLIYLVMVCVIYVHLLMAGVRLFVLRIGLPFACVGLVDHDNGIYAVFIKKIFQTSATVLIQIFLIQLSLFPFSHAERINELLSAWSGNTLQGNPFSVIAAIAILLYGMKVTQDLNEVFLTSAASGEGGKLQSVGYGIQTVMGIFRK